MKYQPLNDLIDPDVPAADAPPVPVPEPEHDPDAPEDAYVIGRPGKMVLTLKKEEEGDRPRAWLKPVAILSAILCVALTIWNISRFAAGPTPTPPATDFQVRQQLYLGVMKVEAYRRGHGVTPDSMHDVGLASPPYAYTRVGPGKYMLGIDLQGRRLEYNSSIPMGAYFGSPQSMLQTGGSR